MHPRYDESMSAVGSSEPRASIDQRSRSLRTISLSIALVVATLIAYFPALSAGFVWDDDEYIWRNPTVAAPEGDLEAVRDIWIPQFDPVYQPHTPQYYPVVFTTFWMEYRLYPGDQRYGTHPLGYHLVNVLLHIANALLIMLLARRIGIAPLLACGIACVFALHPVHVESAAWVTERKNVLSTFFYLLAALAYLRFDSLRSNPLRHSDEDIGAKARARSIWPWYLLSIVLFALALLSKSVSASLPVALVIFLLLRRERLSLARVWPLIPLLFMGAAAGWHTGFLEKYHVGAVGPDWEFTFVDRLLIASRALLFYPWKILWPVDLIFIYPRWEIDARDVVQWLPLIVEALAGVVLIWLWWTRGIRWPLLACAFYAITISPALGFANIYPMRFSFVADHFQYLASLGMIALAIGMLAAIVRKPLAAFASITVIGIALCALTFAQARSYRGEITLYRSIVEANPDAWMAHSNLAREYLVEAEAAPDEGAARSFAERAEHHARQAARIRPDVERPWTNLADALSMHNRFDEAIAALQQGIDALTTERRWIIEHGYKQKLLWADYHLGIDYGSLAILHDSADRPDDAAAAYETALQFIPDDDETRRARLNLHARAGDLYTRLDRLEEAAAHYDFILQMHPDDVLAHLVIGEHRRSVGRYLEAKEHLEHALEAAGTPQEEMQAAYRLGWLCATARDDAARDGQYASTLGDRMVQVTNGTSADAFDLYAAALAELGQFENAISMAQEALTLTEAHRLTELHDRIAARLALYRAGQPHRE